MTAGLPNTTSEFRGTLGAGPELPQTPIGEEAPHKVPEFTFGTVLHSIMDGLRLRCPNCHQGTLFRTFFKMRILCPKCGVVFQREQGEYVGAMYLNIVITEGFFLIGFVLLAFVMHASVLTEILILGPFNALFPVWFYPRSRGLWAAILYLCGDLYAD